MEIGIIVGILLLLFFGAQFRLYRKSKKTVGTDVPFDKLSDRLKQMIKNKKSIIYFYSPSCHACKQQTPVMEDLKKELQNIIMIDASVNMRDAMAFGIMGTPSTIFIRDNKIYDVMVGFRGESSLRKKVDLLYS